VQVTAFAHPANTQVFDAKTQYEKIIMMHALSMALRDCLWDREQEMSDLRLYRTHITRGLIWDSDVMDLVLPDFE